jgi:adenylate cyclase
MKAAARLRGTLRVRTMLAWARLRRLMRNKNLRAVGAAVATLVLLTSLRAYDPRIVTELKERTFDTYQRLKPRT